MLELLIIGGIAWLGLTIAEPFIAYWQAGRDCDIKYAPDRWARMQDEQDMLESFRASRQTRRKPSKKAKKKKETVIDVECIDTNSYPVQKR